MWAEELLRNTPSAYVAMTESAGPYVVPMNFAYKPGAGGSSDAADAYPAPRRLYLHTGPGRKSRALAADPRVCIAMVADVTFDQGPSPCEDGFSYRSVLVEGRARLLEDQGEREAALREIVAKYDPDAAETPFDERPLAQTLVYEITIETLSYRERPRRPPA